MNLKPWWEIYPPRLKYELNALDQAEINYRLDKKCFWEGDFLSPRNN